MLGARTCTQAGLSSSGLSSQASCKCSKVAARSSTGDESSPSDAPTFRDVPSTSTKGKGASAARARRARARAKLSAAHSPSFLNVRESTSRTSLPPRQVHAGMGSLDETAAGRSATTCGIDTDTFLVTFHPSIGSDYTDSCARLCSEEDARQNRGLCRRPPPGTYCVKIPGHRGAEKVLNEGEMPCGCLSAPANCPNGTFIGLRTLKEGTNVGVNTDPDGEIVEPEHTAWVTIVGSSHPRVLLKGHKQQSASPTASQAAMSAPPAQKSVLTGHSYSEATNSAAPPEHKSGPPEVHPNGLAADFLHRVGSSSGASSEGNTRSLLEQKLSQQKLTRNTAEAPGLLLLNGLNKNGMLNVERRREASPSTGWFHFTNDSAKSVDGPRFAVHVSPVPSTETAREDAPPTTGPKGLQKSGQPRALAGADAGRAKQGREPCGKGAMTVPGRLSTKGEANDECFEEGADTVPATLKSAHLEGATYLPRLSRSGLMAEKSHQSGQSSSQYCTAWAEQTGTEFKDSVHTFVFLHSDSSCSEELRCFPSEVAAESQSLRGSSGGGPTAGCKNRPPS